MTGIEPDRVHSALFLAEGTSDAPLADVVELLFRRCGVALSIARPDFDRLGGRVGRDLNSKLRAAMLMMQAKVDVLILHRDANSQGYEARLAEMHEAIERSELITRLVPVIPVRMTEAWLLLDETAIRTVAGNPNGKADLDLPKPHEVERLADPKAVLRDSLLAAAAVTGRRRSRLANRFSSSRRQLLERINPDGPLSQLSGWESVRRHVNEIAQSLRAEHGLEG